MKKKVIGILCGVMFVILAGSIYFVTGPDQAEDIVLTNASEEAPFKETEASGEAKESGSSEASGESKTFEASEKLGALGSSEVSGESEEIALSETAEVSDGLKDIGTICVYVCGAVKQPGVYYLLEEARAVEAIEAASGFSDNADEEYINLARMISDGEKLYVPTREETKEMEFSNLEEESGREISQNTAVNDQQTKTSSGKVNINTAGKEELMTLNGIGEAKAESILSYRDTNGPFQAKEDIMNITGIKDALYQKIADYICVTNEK